VFPFCRKASSPLLSQAGRPLRRAREETPVGEIAAFRAGGPHSSPPSASALALKMVVWSFQKKPS